MQTFTVASVRLVNEALPVPAIEANKTNRGTDTSVGAPMLAEVTIDLDGPATVGDQRWYLNPGLFAPAATSLIPYPGVFYSCEIVGTPSLGAVFPMPLWTGGAFDLQNANLSCSLTVVTATQVRIDFRFRMTDDQSSFVTGAPLTNHDRLFKAHRFYAGTAVLGDAANTQASVYRNTNREIQFRLTLEDSTLDQHTVTHRTPIQARWYFKGLPNNTDAASTPEFPATGAVSFGLFRGGNPVAALSVFNATEVRMWFPYADGTGTYDLEEGAFVYLIREDLLGNLGAWLSDYESSGALITAASIDGANLGGHILVKQPHRVLTSILGVDHVVYRFEANTDVDPAGIYAALFIVRGYPNATAPEQDANFSNSFLLQGLRASDPPDPVALVEADFGGTIRDYLVDAATDNVVSTVVDNLQLVATVNVDAYATAAAAHPYATTWDADVRKITITITNASTLQVYGTRYFTKAGAGAPWMGGVGSSFNNVVVLSSGSTIEYGFEFHACMENLLGYPDFAGQDIRVTWTFEAQYGPDLFTRWNYVQAVHVNDFGNLVKVIQSVSLFDYESGLPLASLCGSDRVLVKVQLDPAQIGTDTWHLRAYWQLEGYGYTEGMDELRDRECPEENGEPSLTGFAQLDNSNLESVPATFDGSGFAQFVFYHGDIPIGEKVRLYVIAEPLDGTPDPCAGRWPDFFFFPPAEVDTMLTTDMQAAVEADPIGYPIGTKILLYDHDASLVAPSTVWEISVGYVITRTTMGAGTFGDEWIIDPVDPGLVVRVMDQIGTEFEHMEGLALGFSALYPTGIAFATPWRPIASVTPPPPPGVTNVEAPTTITFGLTGDSMVMGEDTCVEMVLQYTEDPSPVGATWTDSPLMAPVPQNAGGVGDGWYHGSTASPAKSFTADFPVGATFIRAKYLRGGILQGYSVATPATI